ncbi:hypothetical protein [Streptacidiphilus sp. PAMC 29251]
MKINWEALGSTFGVSMLITVGVVTTFCLGIAALSRHETAAGRSATAGATTAGASARGGSVPALAAATLCFAACAAAVGYGLYLIALA